MPKKSRKSRAKKQNKLSPKALAWLRAIASVLLGVLLLNALALHIAIWPLEFIVSYTPNVIILTSVGLIAYATIASWYLFVYGWQETVTNLGRVQSGVLIAVVLVSTYVLGHSISIVQALPISDELSHDADHLTVGTFNKLYRSEDFSKDANLLTATRTDIVALQEVSEEDIDLLMKRVRHDYSFITDCDCSANDTEVGVLSRFPIINARTVYEHENSVVLRTEMESDDHGSFVVYIVHMHVPYERNSYSLRGKIFEQLASDVNAETLPTFVAGDFNSTIYSPHMQDFMSSTDNKIQNVVTRSWPRCSWFGTRLAELACARIDYVFAPVGSTAYSMEIGEQDASDHRSVTVEVGL